MDRLAAKMAARNFRRAKVFALFSESGYFCSISIFLNPEINGPRALESHCCGFASYFAA